MLSQLTILFSAGSRHPAFAAATLIGFAHLPPRQFLPLIFPPIFYSSIYLNMTGYKHDSAALTGAYSGLYLLLARRSKYNWAEYGRFQRFCGRLAVPVCLMNVVGGGLVYFTEKRTQERDEIRDKINEFKSLFK
jgi:hypothetical protein